MTQGGLKIFLSRGKKNFKVKRKIRKFFFFSTHSLKKAPPFSRLDLISCRNVMIYLGADLQRGIIPLFHYALRSGGYLFLGPSENVTSHQELFQTIDKKHRIFQRKDTLLRPAVRFPLANLSSPTTYSQKDSNTEERNLPKQLERIILQRYGPACDLVSENGYAVFS